MDEIKTRLNQLEELQEDWDSYGGTPPTKEALECAHRFLDTLFIAPLNDGGLQIEMNNEAVIIEIDPDGSWYIEFE